MTRQLCTRAHTENALAMGPKVPYTKDEYIVEEGDVKDSREPIPYREQRKGCRGKPPAAIGFNQYNCVANDAEGGGRGYLGLRNVCSSFASTSSSS